LSYVDHEQVIQDLSINEQHYLGKEKDDFMIKEMVSEVRKIGKNKPREISAQQSNDSTSVNNEEFLSQLEEKRINLTNSYLMNQDVVNGFEIGQSALEANHVKSILQSGGCENKEFLQVRKVKQCTNQTAEVNEDKIEIVNDLDITKAIIESDIEYEDERINSPTREENQQTDSCIMKKKIDNVLKIVQATESDADLHVVINDQSVKEEHFSNDCEQALQWRQYKDKENIIISTEDLESISCFENSSSFGGSKDGSTDSSSKNGLFILEKIKQDTNYLNIQSTTKRKNSVHELIKPGLSLINEAFSDDLECILVEENISSKTTNSNMSTIEESPIPTSITFGNESSERGIKSNADVNISKVIIQEQKKIDLLEIQMLPKHMTHIPKVLETIDVDQNYVESNRESRPTNGPAAVDDIVEEKPRNISEEGLQPAKSSNVSKIFMDSALCLEQAGLRPIEVEGDATKQLGSKKNEIRHKKPSSLLINPLSTISTTKFKSRTKKPNENKNNKIRNENTSASAIDENNINVGNKVNDTREKIVNNKEMIVTDFSVDSVDKGSIESDQKFNNENVNQLSWENISVSSSSDKYSHANEPINFSFSNTDRYSATAAEGITFSFSNLDRYSASKNDKMFTPLHPYSKKNRYKLQVYYNNDVVEMKLHEKKVGKNSKMNQDFADTGTIETVPTIESLMSSGTTNFLPYNIR